MPKVKVRAVFSRREREIAELVCLGKQDKEIAAVLGISVHTVGNHLRSAYTKYGLHSRVEFAVLFLSIEE